MVTATQTTRFLPFLKPTEEIDILETAAIKAFDNGELVLDQNVQLKAIFLIEHGAVRIERCEDDQMVPLALLEAGEFFGEMSFIDDAPTSARIVAAAPTRLRIVEETTVNELIGKDPGFAGRLYRSIAAILAERLRLTSMHLNTLIDGIDLYSQTRAEIEAAAAKLPGLDWRSDQVAALADKERQK